MALVGSWACAENRRSKNPDRRVIARPGGLPGPRKSRARVGARRIADEHRWPERRPDRSAHCRARSPRRRDRGARRASRRRHCAVLDLIREFDARGGWGHGFRSCAHWLSWRVGLEPGAAREHVRVARALGSLPQLREAVARVATPETEERLVAVGRAGTA